MGKYYAVRKGRKPGIYYSWDYCKAQIDGFSGAEYKSFKTEVEAKRYLGVVNSTNNTNNTNSTNSIKNTKNTECKNWDVKAYVDGSFSEKYSVYSYGCVILVDDVKIEMLSGIGNDVDLLDMRNVAGELLGAQRAIEWTIENNYKSVEIYYDYKGIELWATDGWKANKTGTKQYKEFVKKSSRIIDLGFKKVKAHSGDMYNELADKLATDAINKEFIASKASIIELEDSTDELLRLLLNTKLGSKKKQVEWIFDGIILTEGRIDEFVRKQWMNSGNKVKDMKSYTVQVDVLNDSINWQVIDHCDTKYNFALKGIKSRRNDGKL